MNDFDEIKKKLDNYSLDGYNTSQGWDKLQKRNRNKRHLLVRIVIAAACLLLIVGYWSLHQTNEKKQSTVTIVRKEVDKESITTLTDNATPVKAVAINKPPVFSGRKTPNTLVETRIQASSFSQKKITATESIEQLGNAPLANNDISSKELPPAVVVHRPAGPNNSWEIINEQELHAMIHIPEEPRKKNSKLLTFFAEKGEQDEYTDVKFSSMPASMQ